MVVQNLKENDVSVDYMFSNIKELVNSSKNRIYTTINTEMLNLYWQIGKIIVENIQQGDKRANYGEAVLEKLSQKLVTEFGKGFSIINLRRMRKFYCLFQIRSTVLTQLSWSHYLELVRIEEKNFILNK